MKFNLKLDEALFDDELDTFFSKDKDVDIEDIDDDFSEYEAEHDASKAEPGPKEGADTGVHSELIALINDEWEAIQGYTNVIATLRSLISENKFYESAINVLEEISAEENRHVGQLQELLKNIAPNVKEIERGEKEAESQIKLVNGLLPVQSWDDVKLNKEPVAKVANEDEICTLCDVDDEM